jgi:hypothetical protein
MPAYDAFLLVSFGGPEGPADVMPFLQNVTRGRGVPPGRLASVAEHYYAARGEPDQPAVLTCWPRSGPPPGQRPVAARLLGEQDAVPDRHGPAMAADG